MNWIYSENDYRNVIQRMIVEAGNPRGYRTVLAHAAGCKPAYLSQVLGGQVHLTPEHAAALADFWHFELSAAEYFLSLVDLGRAGTEALRKRLKDRLSQLAAQRKGTAKKVEEEDNHTAFSAYYYSTWHASAIHVLLNIEELKTPEMLARFLRVNLSEVTTVLRRLEDANLVQKKGNQWFPTLKHLHVRDSKPLMRMHHRNWRVRSLARIDAPAESDLRFTSVCVLDSEAYVKIREQLQEAIQGSMERIRSAENKMGACLLVDWFPI